MSPTVLEWSQVDLARSLAWIHPDQAKRRKAIAVPLNKDAIEVLKRRQGIHPARVFTYKGRPAFPVATRGWQKALKRAGITDFRLHDQRHTWASWHVRKSSSLYEVQGMGAWRSADLVRRYAHVQPGKHLLTATRRIEGGATATGTIRATVENLGKPRGDTKELKSFEILVAREGIEPRHADFQSLGGSYIVLPINRLQCLPPLRPDTPRHNPDTPKVSRSHSWRGPLHGGPCSLGTLIPYT